MIWSCPCPSLWCSFSWKVEQSIFSSWLMCVDKCFVCFVDTILIWQGGCFTLLFVVSVNIGQSACWKCHRERVSLVESGIRDGVSVKMGRSWDQGKPSNTSLIYIIRHWMWGWMSCQGLRPRTIAMIQNLAIVWDQKLSKGQRRRCHQRKDIRPPDMR